MNNELNTRIKQTVNQLLADAAEAPNDLERLMRIARLSPTELVLRVVYLEGLYIGLTGKAAGETPSIE